MRLVVLAALCGCYQAPASDSTCAIVCEDSCPDGLTCHNGFCVADGQTCEPELVTVHAGNGFACALDAQKRRWCWGSNDHHQLAASDEAVIPYATLIDKGWDVLATGGDHMCGMRDGNLYCWGGNARQQVSGGVAGDVAEPLLIPPPGDVPWRFVATGFNATCAIADGLYCWGGGDDGQLGNGATGDTGAPTLVASTLEDWTTVSLGFRHSCAISASAGLHCWGYNGHGEIGDGTTTTVFVPTAVDLPGATSVAVASESTCAVAADRLYCWGQDGSTQLGDPQLTDRCLGNRHLPGLASGLAGWTKVSASQALSCALRGDEVWCWGNPQSGVGIGTGVWGQNGWGRIAIGASDVSLGWSSARDELGDPSDTDLACIIVDGVVKCWGDNRYGQLADGGSTMHTEPREIAGNHRWSSLLASDNHTCGITTDRDLYCWGHTSSGQTNNKVAGTSQTPCGLREDLPCTLPEPTLVAFHPKADEIGLGEAHTCALVDGTLTCWGSNGSGRLGATNATSPMIMPGTWSRVFNVGSAGSCAVQNGQTWCWGAVTGLAQAPAHDPRLDGMSWIFVNAQIDEVGRNGGSAYTTGCILDANSQLACFGDNSQGQYGIGPPVNQCGNGTCEYDERVETCAADCIATDSPCTTNTCTNVMTCTPDYSICGDGRCAVGYGETCANCAEDCSACGFTSLGRTYTALAVSTISTTSYVCGVLPDGQVECWGRNDKGQAGVYDPATGAPPFVYTPAIVPGLQGCTAIAAGEETTCAVCFGELYCWGNNRRGYVGSGTASTTPVTTPRRLAVELDTGDSWVDVTMGVGYACARTMTGRGFCWGEQRQGALGTGGTSANIPTDIEFQPR